jgi:putative FmdB family regulatory protein
MKLMMFDFVCSCGNEFEELTGRDDPVSCPDCGALASRTISPVRIDRTAIALTKGASPESIAHFDRIHRERKAIEEKRYERNGDYGHGSGSD